MGDLKAQLQKVNLSRRTAEDVQAPQADHRQAWIIRKSNWIFTEKLREGSGAGYKHWGRDIASLRLAWDSWEVFDSK